MWKYVTIAVHHIECAKTSPFCCCPVPLNISQSTKNDLTFGSSLFRACRDKPALIWQMMNVCALEYPDESFNAVMDKGTLDSVLCGEGSTANVAKMCMEISRVLKPNGICFICSYGIPDNRLQVRYDFRPEHDTIVMTKTRMVCTEVNHVFWPHTVSRLPCLPLNWNHTRL